MRLDCLWNAVGRGADRIKVSVRSRLPGRTRRTWLLKNDFQNNLTMYTLRDFQLCSHAMTY